MPKAKIVVVEDEENLLEAIRYNLQEQGYEVITETDGLLGLSRIQAEQPDLAILDIMLPGMDGLEICREIRREHDMPITILTARDEEIDRIVGLELGADDYITKPFSMRELMARVRAQIRRYRLTTPAKASHEGEAEILISGNLELDVQAHKARMGGRELSLRPREFNLLALFMRGAGRVFTRDQVLQALWSQDYIGDARTVDVHVRWLRAKIEDEPSSPTRIVTVRGVGYRFEG